MSDRAKWVLQVGILIVRLIWLMIVGVQRGWIR